MPKRVKFLRFAEKYRLRLNTQFGVGDHLVYQAENGERVHINYRQGEIDIASMKAVARLVGLTLYDAVREARMC